MKMSKKLVLILIIFTILGIAIFNDKLIAIAQTYIYSLDTFTKGHTIKSGEDFSIEMRTGSQYCEEVLIHLFYEENGVQYSTFINSSTGILVDHTKKDYYTEALINADKFAQEPGKMPTVNGKVIHWVYDGYESFISGYCLTDMEFIGYVYKEPRFILECEDDIVEYGEKVTCTISTEYSYTLEEAEFNLHSDDFILNDVTALEGWKVTSDDKVIATAENIPEISNPDSTQTDEIFTFTVTPKEDKRIVIERAVIADNIKYKDVRNSGDHPELVAPMEVPTKEDNQEEQEIENPNTGIENYLEIAVLVAMFAIVAIILIRKKDYFKNV